MTSVASIPVSLEARTRGPAAAAAPVLETMLRELEANPGMAGLAIDLARDLQMPIEAELKVPITVTLVAMPGPHQFDIRFAAATPRDYYPHFAGTLKLSDFPNSTCLSLVGSYTVPLAGLGSMIDMTFLRGAAGASLQRYLERLAKALAVRVRDEEEAHARAAMHFHV